MQKTEPFGYGNFYHVFNCGIDGCNIFKEPENYAYFLALYDKYISPIADTFAWVLMPNHFHMLVRVIDETVVDNPDGVQNPVRVEKTGTPSQQMSKLFNAYAQAFNKRFQRHGGLFERPFKRKKISGSAYLRNVILYIHNNPVHHHFCKHPLDYPWSSYLTCISMKPTKLRREQVIGWFDDEANFKYMHDGVLDIDKIEKWLEI
jgi:REP element-mobilizing transposase RayT